MGETDFDGGPEHLLFVCTGNTCRSPTAEALAREEGRRRGLDVACRSAGVAASGGGASAGAVRAARKVGLDLSGHTSTQLGRELVDWADLILCMGESHRWQVADRGGGEKARLVTDFLPEDDPRRGRPVLDPVGGETDVYRQTLEVLRASIAGLMDAVEEAAGGSE